MKIVEGRGLGHSRRATVNRNMGALFLLQCNPDVFCSLSHIRSIHAQFYAYVNKTKHSQCPPKILTCLWVPFPYAHDHVASDLFSCKQQ